MIKGLYEAHLPVSNLEFRIKRLRRPSLDSAAVWDLWVYGCLFPILAGQITVSILK